MIAATFRANGATFLLGMSSIRMGKVLIIRQKVQRSKQHLMASTQTLGRARQRPLQTRQRGPMGMHPPAYFRTVYVITTRIVADGRSTTLLANLIFQWAVSQLREVGT
jgi:hypothetical protein